MASRCIRILSMAFLLCIGVGPVLAQGWIELTPPSGPEPSARRYASSIYDPVGHRMVIFGGQINGGTANDVWAFDLTLHSWTDLTPTGGSAPDPRRTPASIYDPVLHRMITWSGQSGGTFFNDVWSFDLNTLTWTEGVPASSPNPRYGVASTYDPVGGDLVTFAGFTNQGRFDDTWRYDAAADTWTDVTPAGTSPPMRCLHSASYDSRNHRMIMYGGQQSGPLDDIWAFDLTSETWTEFNPATRPLGRFHTAHVYDAANHRSTIFGGTRGAAGGGNTDEVWLFDLSLENFVQMFPTGTPPSAREGATGIYIQAEDRMVIFGGHDGGYVGDVWSLNDLSSTITASPPSATSPTRLFSNWPNPFNPSTTIQYELSREGHLKLEVFDSRGRWVRTLLDGPRPAGPGSILWNGTDGAGRTVASGVYLYQLRAGDFVETKTMVLLK